MKTTRRRSVQTQFVGCLLMLACAAVRAGAIGEPCSNNQVPYVSITKPTNGQYFTWGATVRVQATAGDTDGTITNVEFFADGALLGSVTSPPYTNIWPSVYPPPDQSDWRYRLTARAWDNCGVCVTSAPVEILNGQSPWFPLVTIYTPNGQTVFRPGSTVTLNASVSVGDGSENSVELYIGGQLLGLALYPAYLITLTNLAAGEYVITARYTDDLRNVGGTIRPVTLTVANLALINPRLNAAGEFSFAVSGVVTGASLVLLGSSNLVNWEPMQTNVPTTSLIDLNTGPVSYRPQFFFRVEGGK